MKYQENSTIISRLYANTDFHFHDVTDFLVQKSLYYNNFEMK